MLINYSMLFSNLFCYIQLFPAFFIVRDFQSPDFSGSRFLRSRFFRVRAQGLGPGFRSSLAEQLLYASWRGSSMTAANNLLHRLKGGCSLLKVKPVVASHQRPAGLKQPWHSLGTLLFIDFVYRRLFNSRS